MMVRPNISGKKKYYSNRFRSEYSDKCRNDIELVESFQTFIDSLEKGNVPAERIIIRGKKPKKKCTGFTVYKSRARTSNGSYRVMYSIKNGSVLFVQLHNKNKNSEEMHDEGRICDSLGTIANHTCASEFTKQEKPLAREVLKI